VITTFHYTPEVVLRGPHSPFRSLPAYTFAPTKCSVKCLHCAMFVLTTSLCLEFSGADIEFEFDLNAVNA